MKKRDPKFDEFKPAALPPQAFDVAAYLRNGCTQEEAEIAVESARNTLCYVNALYQVNVARAPVGNDWPPMLWLSIKRRDRRPLHDWRHLQRIKNAIVGPEHEAVELYPAESRMVDEANQYHLWVLEDPTARFPFGHTKRLVGTPEQAAAMGAVQRPFDD